MKISLNRVALNFIRVGPPLLWKGERLGVSTVAVANRSLSKPCSLHTSDCRDEEEVWVAPSLLGVQAPCGQDGSGLSVCRKKCDQIAVPRCQVSVSSPARVTAGRTQMSETLCAAGDVNEGEAVPRGKHFGS